MDTFPTTERIITLIASTIVQTLAMNTQSVPDSTSIMASALTGGVAPSLQIHNPDTCATASRVEALRRPATATTMVEVMYLLHVIQSRASMCNQASALVDGLRCGKMDISLITEKIITSAALQIALQHAMVTTSVLGSTPRMAGALIGVVARSVPTQMQVIVATPSPGVRSIRLKTSWIWRWTLKSMSLRCPIPRLTWKMRMSQTLMRRLVFRVAAGAIVAVASQTGATGVGATEACAEPVAMEVDTAGTGTITTIAHMVWAVWAVWAVWEVSTFTTTPTDES